MLKIHKQQQAEQDLIEIWMYSCGNWGVNQVDIYLDQLDQAFQNIASNPEIDVNIDYFRTAFFKYPAKEHLIFYTIQKSTIHMVRVLGNEMDYIQHL